MQTITATELRRKTKKVFDALEKGQTIELIKGSRVVGQIKPKREGPGPLTEKDIKELKKLSKKLNLPSLTYKERERRKRDYLTKKYGRSVS